MQSSETLDKIRGGLQPIPIQRGTLKKFLGDGGYEWFQDFFTDPEVLAIEENQLANESPEILALQMMNSEVFQEKVAEIRDFGASLILQQWFPEFAKQTERRLQKGPKNGKYYVGKLNDFLNGLRMVITSVPKEAVVMRHLAQELYDSAATRCVLLINAYLGEEQRTEQDDKDVPFITNESTESWSFERKLNDANNAFYWRYDTEHPILGLMYMNRVNVFQYIKDEYTEPDYRALLDPTPPEFSADFVAKLAEQRSILQSLSITRQVDDEVEFTSPNGDYLTSGVMSFPIHDRSNNYQELQRSMCLIDTDPDDESMDRVSLELNRSDGHLHISESNIPFYCYFTQIEDYEKLVLHIYELAIKAYEESETKTELVRFEDYADQQLRKTRTRNALAETVEAVTSITETESPEDESPPSLEVVVETATEVSETLTGPESTIVLNRAPRFDTVLAGLSLPQQEKTLRRIEMALSQFGTGSSKNITKMEIPGKDTIFRVRIGGRRILFRHDGNQTFSLFNMDPRPTVYEQDLKAIINTI